MVGKKLSSLRLIAYFMVLFAFGGAMPIAVANPSGDDTATLQAQLDNVAPGGTLTLTPGTYEHSGMLYLRVPGVRINGNGATLRATNDATSALWITADGVSLSNVTLSAAITGKRLNNTDQAKLVVAGESVKVSDVTINGSAGVGVFVAGGYFQLDRVVVRDTLADGIHMSAGAHDGVLNNPVTERTGDDGIAVVSYSPEFHGERTVPCHDIVVNSPVVDGTTNARGITVSGGLNITFKDVRVSNTSSAAIYIASEGAPFFTQSSSNVLFEGGIVKGAYMNTGEPARGAVVVAAGHDGYNVTNATVSDLTIIDTNPAADRNVLVSAAGGTVGGIVLRNIHIQQKSNNAPMYSNAPKGAVTALGFTVNGSPVTVA